MTDKMSYGYVVLSDKTDLICTFFGLAHHLMEGIIGIN